VLLKKTHKLSARPTNYLTPNRTDKTLIGSKNSKFALLNLILLPMKRMSLTITPPTMETNKSESKLNEAAPRPFFQTFFHGTKADLKIGDLIVIGTNSNYGQRNKAKYIYLTATLDAAIWGAELALGEGRGRIYLVETIRPHRG
jgi:hypothetical protein